MIIVNKRLLTLILSSYMLSIHAHAADDSQEINVDIPIPKAIEEYSLNSAEPEHIRSLAIIDESKEIEVVVSDIDQEQDLIAKPDDIKPVIASPEPAPLRAAPAQPISITVNDPPLQSISKPINKPSIKKLAENKASQEVTDIKEAKIDTTELSQLISLNGQNKFTLAYQLALGMYNNWEGDEQFDFNFALAAAQTAHYNEAIFPFERLLEAHPNNLRFRLELARCHFFLNNLGAAEREFKLVAANKPPAEVKDHIERFLTRIAEKKQQVTRSWQAGVGLALGYDSNINAAADLDAIDATFYTNNSPTLTGVLTLEDEQKSQASSYYQLQGYGQYQLPLSKRTSIDFSLIGSIKDNSIDDTYDLTNIALNGGFRILRSNHNLRFGGIVRQYWLAGESLQNQLLANVAWQWHFAPYWKTTAEFELGQQDSDQNDALDFTQWQGKAALNRKNDGFSQNVQLGFGSDMASDSINDFQGRNYYALSYQAQQALAADQQAYALINYRSNTYSDAFADDHIFFAGETREDQLMQIIAGWIYEFMPNTSAKLQLSHSQNQSNLELYDYQRTLLEAGLAISFK